MPKADPESHKRARRKFNKSNKTESGNDLPHHDLGGGRLDRSLADTLPIRRERSDHMALAQFTVTQLRPISGAESNTDNIRGTKMPNPLKLYNHALAPNPRRVRIFAAEKAIELRVADVDILAGQSRTPEFLTKNSSGGVPVLELDDGYASPSRSLSADIWRDFILNQTC